MQNILNLVEANLGLLKIFFISIYTMYTSKRIIDETNKTKLLQKSMIFILICLISYVYFEYKYISGSLYSTMLLIVGLSIVFSRIYKKEIIFSILINIVSYGINYIVFACSVLLSFIPSKLGVDNKIIEFAMLITIYIILITLLLRVRKVKNGLIFFKDRIGDEYFNLIILNLSIIIISVTILSTNYKQNYTVNFLLTFVVFAFILFITIQKSLQLYYKQKLLEKDLNETKEELAKKIKEVEELEAENLSISKKSHTLVHKQKSLEYKLEEILNKTEISTEEAAEARERLKEIEKDLYKEKNTVKLDKTGIPQIDDMLEYMQSECKKNKIDFELQINGNIHYMTNNLIPKEDLETLLADHIKNAIIAINHTDNVNRSILVRLGEIDGIYSLYIYDSGIEFEKETLENLGKKPSTTHENEGGTGMGFMNTFDTLRKCEASLIINEFNEPSKDNYTKAIIIKFDKKNEFKIISYR